MFWELGAQKTSTIIETKPKELFQIAKNLPSHKYRVVMMSQATVWSVTRAIDVDGSLPSAEAVQRLVGVVGDL